MADIEKNNNEIIRNQQTEYKSHEFIDMRIYFKNDKQQWTATKKGLTFHPESLSEVIAALVALKEE